MMIGLTRNDGTEWDGEVVIVNPAYIASVSRANRNGREVTEVMLGLTSPQGIAAWLVLESVEEVFARIERVRAETESRRLAQAQESMLDVIKAANN